MQWNADVYEEDGAEGETEMFNYSSVLAFVHAISSFLHDCFVKV